MRTAPIAAVALVVCLLPTTISFAHPNASHEKHDDVCDAHADEGAHCWIAIEDLRPTQLTVGAIEVERRAAGYAELSDDKREDYLKKNPVPVVLGPDGDFYITDHHHLALAVAGVEGKKFQIAAVIQKNWRHLDTTSFWANMASAQFTYLYDADGHGPYAISALADDLFSLENDSFRSLAWGVRKAGGYDDSDVPHADFMWADYFRALIDRRSVENDFDRAVMIATPWAHADRARHLPGYQL